MGVRGTYQAIHCIYQVINLVVLLVLNQVLQVPRTHWESRRAGDCMVPLSEVPVFEASAPAQDALIELVDHPLRRGLVLERGQLVGLVSVRDLIRVLQPRSNNARWRRFLP